MSDTEIREAERAGDWRTILVQKLRGGLDTKLHKYRRAHKHGGVTTFDHRTGVTSCERHDCDPPCHTTTLADVPTADAVNLAAWVNSKTARDLVDPPFGYKSWERVDHLLLTPSAGYTAGLRRLLRSLPDVMVSGVACSHLTSPYSTIVGLGGEAIHCPDCNGTGILTVETTAARYVSVLCVWRAAKEALSVWKGCEGQGNMEADTDAAMGCDACKTPRHALNAVERWLICPCPKRRDYCDDNTPEFGDAPHDPFLVGIHHLCSAVWDEDEDCDIRWSLDQFCHVTSPEAVRRSVQRAALGVVGLPEQGEL